MKAWNRKGERGQALAETALFAMLAVIREFGLLVWIPTHRARTATAGVQYRVQISPARWTGYAGAMSGLISSADLIRWIVGIESKWMEQRVVHLTAAGMFSMMRSLSACFAIHLSGGLMTVPAQISNPRRLV